MDKSAASVRTKSPKKISNGSIGSLSGNNNVGAAPPHPAFSKGSLKSSNNNVPRNAVQKNKPKRTKSPLTPEEKSKLAREKFQSLISSANKVNQNNTAGSPPPSTTTAASIGLGLGSGFISASPLTPVAAAPLNIPEGPSKTVVLSPTPPPIQSVISRQAVNVNVSKSGAIPLTLSLAPRNNLVPATSSFREATIAAMAKANSMKNPNQFPNIDPRTFPKSLGQSVNIPQIYKPYPTKSMASMVDRSRNLRQFVEKAIVDQKIFSCVGVYPAVKNALKKRGWVEKTGPINVVRSAGAPSQARLGVDEESDSAWIARTLRDYPPDFTWVIRRDNIDWKNMHKDQIINRFPKAWFTTKVGLVACLQQMHWYSEAGFSETFFPRCYRLCLEDERLAFQEDYRLTACMSYLRHFVENYESKGPGSLVDPQSRITPLSIDFASRQLGNYIRMRRHEDIDWLLPPNFMSQHWDAFVHQYYMVVHEKKKVRFESIEGVRMKYDMAKKTLQRTSQYWPQAHLDGYYNMWICKPGARSRGKGIVIMNSVEKILDLLNHGNSREANWVVQKYMERPLLVYKTKFDMRQWFIISDWTPLTLWFYKESYIRFCTKPFVLEDFHESIHLCNNAIQCRYQNAQSRDAALPDENMWDCYTFQAYLKSIGKLDQWPKIYNGMKQAIIGVLLASQESVDTRKGCFELYGADFMLSEDFNVWLIEINSCPCMASTTSITARMCAQCLEDAVKVIVDRRTNKNAETGMFEMVYRQPLGAVTVQQFTGHDLVIHGKKLTRDVDWPGAISSKSVSQSRRPSVMTSSLNKQQFIPLSVATSPAENLTFSDLLQKLRMKNTQMFQGFVSNNKASTLAAVAAPDAVDQSVTSVLLNKMRALNKLQQQQQAIENTTEILPPGMLKKPYPPPKSNQAPGSLANLSKYFDENSSTFANLVKIGKDISIDITQEKESRRPASFGSTLMRSAFQGNPYIPRSETAKTLEEVRIAVNAASAKYAPKRAHTTHHSKTRRSIKSPRRQTRQNP